jgi:glycosyltransferase involved in cell wall biosynthesis
MNLPSKPIALLIPAYNHQDRLAKTLASLEPDLHLLEIILVDDGSTPPISIDKFPHCPIHLIRLPANRGIVGALNAGLEYLYAQHYEFIARLDSDDVVINQRFTKQLAFLRTHPDIGLVGSLFHVVNREGHILSNSVRPLEDANIRKAMHIGCMLGHPTLMMRTDIARTTGFYDKAYPHAEDYEFYWRMLAHTKVANLPDYLVQCAISTAGAISKDNQRRQALSALKIKLHHFRFLSIFAYMGLIISLLDVTDTLKYTIKVRKAIMDKLFPE